ncbi:MAG: SDR family oxidoreductase [Chloroflexi bacterium]|nr:SDR family oxidoreductase [Chloroflexota bacterium]
MQLAGKIALVTGGARRLGRAFTLALAKAGMDVIVHYGHAAQEAEETARLAREQGVRSVTLAADLEHAEEAQALIPRAIDLIGQPPHVLVNNAAVFLPGTVRTTTLENWVQHMRLNLRAPFLLIQALANHLPEGTPGKIVNIADWRALYPGRQYLAYTISKAGLITLTQIAARELAPHIQVNALALGAVLPPPDRDETYLQRLVQHIPARRAARIEEVTDALLFLLRNDYVTGETLLVDGGAHLF